MTLSLTNIRRLAVDVAREESPALEVVGTTNAEGAANYAEVIVADHSRRDDSRHLVIGLSRSASESAIRDQLRDRLREGLRNPD
jgi:hypothetical protein